MYVDVYGLVTVGVGNLIDKPAQAAVLPFRHEKTGALATPAEITGAWHDLKAQKEKFAKLHWKYAAALNDLRLDDAAIDALVARKLEENVAFLRKTFTKWDTFPADAQLGILSMAWAVGPGFTLKFGNFTKAALAGDWKVALACCKIRDGLDTPSKADDNPGIVPRNAMNRLCFANADIVAKNAMDVHVLHWPDVAVVPSALVDPQKLADDSHILALEAQRDARVVLAAFVAREAERLKETGSGRATLDYEAKS